MTRGPDFLKPEKKRGVGKGGAAVHDPAKRYHGAPCIHGHGTLRYVSSRNCVVCANGLKAKRYRTDPKFRERHLDRLREKARGVTAEQYAVMLQSQNGACICCGGTNPNNRKLSVDHNHTTDQVRDLLCNRCNMAIGFLESPLLPVWQAYLERHNAP